MRVEVRRYATLAATGRAPGEPETVDVNQGATTTDLLGQLGIQATAVHLVIVNGRILRDGASPLAEGDRVAFFPPVGGG